MIFVDATYKLIDWKIPVYILLLEDGNGQSEVGGIGLLVNEEYETLLWFFQTFKRLNSASTLIRLFVSDKDMKERSVIREVFPNASLEICLFHSLRTFNRELTCEKRGITPKVRDQVKSIFEKLCYSKNEEEYSCFYKHLQEVAPNSVLEYFDNNWHDLRNEWVTGLTSNNGNFMNLTNNRLENFNGKLKSVIPIFSNFETFVDKLFVVIRCLRLERDKNALKMVQKQPTISIQNPELVKYFNLLTLYAFEFLKKQFQSKVSFNQNTTEKTCNCQFFMAMRLPCCHIFEYRRKSSFPLYDSTLCDKRWSREFYYRSQRALKTAIDKSERNQQDDVEINFEPRIEQIKSKKPKSSHEKFRKASICTSKIAELISYTSNVHFDRKLEQLNLLLSSWSDGKEISITVIDGINLYV